MTDPDDLLLSDAERLHALTVLGDHYANGRLDQSEFHDRSGVVAAARTLGELAEPFRGLPDGVPLKSIDGRIVRSASGSPDGGATVGGELTPTSSSSQGVGAADHPGRDLAEISRKGRTLEAWDGVVFGITLVVFLVLQIVVDWEHAWIVWPTLLVTLGVPRAVMRFGGEDEKLYAEIKQAEAAARSERVRAAQERIRELGDGREGSGGLG